MDAENKRRVTAKYICTAGRSARFTPHGMLLTARTVSLHLAPRSFQPARYGLASAAADPHFKVGLSTMKMRKMPSAM